MPPTTDTADEQLERGVLGALLLAPDVDAAERLITALGEPANFDRPRVAEVWQTASQQWATTGRADIHSVIAALRANLRPVDPLWVLGCTDVDHTPATQQHALDWAVHVADKGRRRRVVEELTRALQQAENGVDGVGDTMARIERLQPAQVAAVHVPTIAEDMALLTDDDHRDWVIPGLLERGDRLLLTGGEGSGKSTLIRQIAFQVAAGLHPFNTEDITPARVLLIDVENPENIFRREVRPLYLKCVQAGFDPDLFRVDRALGGLNLADPTDLAWLRARIADARPDLLLIGPLYKLAGANADSNDEKDMKPVAFALDKLRAEYGFALICETHSNKMVKDGTRSMEPNGWSGWLRWPEFGYCITPADEFRSWRGDRSQREWPTSLRRGGSWPFSADSTVTDHRWRAIRACLADANERLSEREIASRTDLSQTTVHRTIEARRDVYDGIWRLLPEPRQTGSGAA